MSEKANVLPGENASFGQDVDFYKFLQVGVITRVDNERLVADIQFQSAPNIAKSVPLTDVYFTGRSFVGGMPEEGTVVICGFIKLTNKIGTPVILSYLSSDYLRSLSQVYDTGRAADEVAELTSIHEKIGYNIRRLKRRKLYPGDVNLESTQGSEILLDDDVLLSDKKLNEIKISSFDRKILQNSVNSQIYTNACRILNGLVERPFSAFVEPVILENGKSSFVVTENKNSPNYNARAFTEHRMELRETGDNVLDVVDSYDFKDYTQEKPVLVSQMFGTLVGNNRQDIQKYGQVLRPQIFASDDVTTEITDVICTPEQQFNLAGAYQLAFNSGTKYDIDKEGHAFVHLAASSKNHPLGAGRSLEFAADGGIKLLIGNTAIGEKSIDLTTTGKAQIHLGSDSESLTSLQMTLDRSIELVVNNANADGVAKTEEYFGTVNEIVHGDKTITVDGALTYFVQGKIKEEITGAKTQNYIDDYMVNYGGSYQQIVTYSKQVKIGEGLFVEIAKDGYELKIFEGDKKEELILGNKEVELKAGDSKETLTLGDKETNLTLGDLTRNVETGDMIDNVTKGNRETNVETGDISESVKLGDILEAIETGNKEISIKSGNFEVTINSGNIEIKTTTGTVNVQSETQAVTVEGLLTVDVKAGQQVNVSAPIVEIGSSPAMGGVVTGQGKPPNIVPSHLDYITGAPLLASKSVSSSN